MADEEQIQLGAVQETLFIPLYDRARQARRRNPVLRDPKAEQIVDSVGDRGSKYVKNRGGVITVLRTAVYDTWVRDFLAEHPDGLVVELGTGLNSRFDRVDNGRVRWIDLDLPDTIELRRRFFTDTDRCHMLAGSVLDESWMDVVSEQPGPYFFVSEGVLTYLDEDSVLNTLRRIVGRFPGSRLAFDTYHAAAMRWQHRVADSGQMEARWSWACDDPRTLEPLGLRIVESTRATRPPQSLRRQLPLRYRLLMPPADLLLRNLFDVTLFEIG
jgi:O-methyltransferase involved in polyketide biosynthesis